MTPDPVFDKLARFTPDAGGLDPADVLFRAGRASARTPRYWKLAVVALLLMNTVLLVAPRRAPSRGDVVPAYLNNSVPQAASEPALPPEESPWTPHSLLGSVDPDRAPRPEAMSGLAPASAELTPLSARRVNFD